MFTKSSKKFLKTQARELNFRLNGSLQSALKKSTIIVLKNKYICSNPIDLFSLCSRSLQQKKPVTAETFESVTVYFSDIHDFSTLTAESTPLEVQFVIQISEVMVIS